jgi:hypothetical protein
MTMSIRVRRSNYRRRSRAPRPTSREIAAAFVKSLASNPSAISLLAKERQDLSYAEIGPGISGTGKSSKGSLAALACDDERVEAA